MPRVLLGFCKGTERFWDEGRLEFFSELGTVFLCTFELKANNEKIEISITDEQDELLSNEIKAGAKLNFEEETFSGFGLTLNVVEGNISWLEFEMYGKIDLSEVSWILFKS